MGLRERYLGVVATPQCGERPRPDVKPVADEGRKSSGSPTEEHAATVGSCVGLADDQHRRTLSAMISSTALVDPDRRSGVRHRSMP